ncbi:hypothetical protein ACFVXG_18020 [Kitasatospora sp. NPDC058162]|uniref:hypothetical protein n=1 Tax=Kitasatospora sp. NPDC058162 TaxID=3346362 RepID=UPI0036D9F2ED
MPDWTGGLAHAIAAAGIVTAALSGAAATDGAPGPAAHASVNATDGPKYFTTTARSEVLGTGPSYFSVTAAQDTQGPTYFPS